MPNPRRTVVYVLIFLALLVFLVGLSQAASTSFRVQSEAELTHPINLVAEDRVLIQYKAVGEDSNTLNFKISFPNATVRDFGTSGDFSYSFICDLEGQYVLHFVNTDQSELLVTLNYEIQHYIFGIPQMLFMVLIIVLVCIGGVVAFVLLGRSS